MHIQVGNRCIIALTNLPLQVKKTGEEKAKHTGEPVGGSVSKELKDFTCKALSFKCLHPEKANREGTVRNLYLSTSFKQNVTNQ